jgi:hypothetical protein
MLKRRIWLIVGIGLMVIGLLLGLPSLLQNSQEANVPKVSAASFTKKSQTEHASLS